MAMPGRFISFSRQSFLFATAGILLFCGVLALYARQYGWFEPTMKIILVVPNSRGLAIGTPVELSGMRVGVLDRMSLLPDGRVRLQLRVPKRFQAWISPRSTARIGNDGLLGDALIDISAAPMPPEAVPATFTVASSVAPGVDDLLVGLEQSRKDLKKLLLSTTRITEWEVPQTLRQVRTSLQSGTAVSATINRELPPTAAQLRATLSTATRTASAAESTATEVEQAVREVRPDLKESMRDFASVMRRTNGLLEQFSGFLQPLTTGDGSTTPAPSGQKKPTNP